MTKKTDEPDDLPYSISQNMTNSPGGIQAGGNVTINREPESRHLTAEQRVHLVALLKANSKGIVTITCALGGSEPCDFANELRNTLEEADWPVKGVRETLFFTSDVVGLFIRVHSKEDAPYHGAVLQRALIEIGFPSTAVPDNRIPVGYVDLLIGFRPKAELAR